MFSWCVSYWNTIQIFETPNTSDGELKLCGKITAVHYNSDEDSSSEESSDEDSSEEEESDEDDLDDDSDVNSESEYSEEYSSSVSD